jgi:GT2 family glycosyltransferase
MTVAPAAPLGADIIVCVHNSPEDVRSCLSSVLHTLRPGDRLVIVDDGSADETRLICEAAAAEGGSRVHLIRRSEGSGFCRAANAGLRESDAPISVLLNSDTIVTQGWLDRIRTCMSSNWQIGVAGPLSNAGGWQSIPDYMTGGPANNAVQHDEATLDAIQAWCSGMRPRYPYPIVEQVNGFCIAIRRDVLDAVGLFDEELFPMGYGEETDFVMRAQDAGFLCAVAVDCFVYHAKTKSYSSEARQRYIKTSRAHLDRVHGAERVHAAVKGTQTNPILEAIRVEARAVFEKNGWLLEG